jgi:hypothetical protein
MIAEGRYKGGHPVVGLIHNRSPKHYEPRPLDPERSSLAVPCRTGRRTPSLCCGCCARSWSTHLRNLSFASDRYQHNATDTLSSLAQQVERRTLCILWRTNEALLPGIVCGTRSKCPHDNLLLNGWNRPCKVSSLRYFFNKVLCKNHQGKIVNSVGFEKWSTHRLRHTWQQSCFAAARIP